MGDAADDEDDDCELVEEPAPCESVEYVDMGRPVSVTDPWELVRVGWLTLVSVGVPVDIERMLPGSETGVENGSESVVGMLRVGGRLKVGSSGSVRPEAGSCSDIVAGL